MERGGRGGEREERETVMREEDGKGDRVAEGEGGERVVGCEVVDCVWDGGVWVVLWRSGLLLG